MIFQELLNSKQKNVYLLGPQDFEPLLLESVQAPCVYVDGGTRWKDILLQSPSGASRIGRGIAIGDGDSSGYSMDLTLPQKKDFSDFAYVLKNLPKSFQFVHCYGFLGGRRDHEILNLGEAHHFLKLRDRTVLNFDRQVWAFSAGEWAFYLKGEFSVVTFEACDWRLEGLCDYQVKEDRKIQPFTSFGLSNSGEGEVRASFSAPFFIYSHSLRYEEESQ